MLRDKTQDNKPYYSHPELDSGSINADKSPLRDESTLTDSVSWHGMTKKPAFTLAEVLITLGIIGVVDAMTIPTLNANTRSSQISFKI